MQIIVLFVVLVGCGASVTYGEWPYKATPCIPGDKAAAWDAYTTWYNVLLVARRTRQEYCEWRPNATDARYAVYCVELDMYHARVERYVDHLKAAYTNTCPLADSWF